MHNRISRGRALAVKTVFAIFVAAALIASGFFAPNQAAAVVSGVAYNLGSYNWDTVAAGITTDISTYKIRIQEHGGAVQSSSPTNFRIDNVAPTITSVTTYDTNANGTVDKTTIVFSEPVDDSDFEADDFTIDGQAGTAIVTGTADDDTFDVTFTTVVGTGAKSLIHTADGGADID